MLPILAAILAALGVFALFILGVWAVPILLAAAALALIHIVASRKTEGPGAGAVERSRATEPTGTPRKASGGAETANERVGQT
jgi:hypothetical protein